MAAPAPSAWVVIGALSLAVLLASLIAMTAAAVRLCVSPPRARDLRDRIGLRAIDPDSLMRTVAALLGLNALLMTGCYFAFKGQPGAWDASRGLLFAAQTLTFHWAALALAFWAAGRDGSPARTRLGLDAAWPRAVGMGLWSYLAIIPFVIGVAIVWNGMLHGWGFQPTPQSFLDVLRGDPHGLLKAYLVFTAVALAPLSEELLFRGLLMPFLARRAGLAVSITASAALFALLHFNLAAFMPIFLLGLALGGLYALTGRIAASISLHALFNGVNLSLFFFFPEWFKTA